MAKQNKYPDINFKDKDVQKITAGRDTTAIPTPYKVTAKEAYPNGIYSLETPTKSTVEKMKYNSQTVVPALMKRNQERVKEGQKPISYQSITGSPVVPFSKKGK